MRHWSPNLKYDRKKQQRELGDFHYVFSENVSATLVSSAYHHVCTSLTTKMSNSSDATRSIHSLNLHLGDLKRLLLDQDFSFCTVYNDESSGHTTNVESARSNTSDQTFGLIHHDGHPRPPTLRVRLATAAVNPEAGSKTRTQGFVLQEIAREVSRKYDK